MRMNRWAYAAATLAVGAMIGVSGCQKQTARNGEGAAVLSATELYHAGRFSEAKARAEIDFRRLDGEPKRTAALTAGLSAQALNKTAEARGWLEPLATDPNPEIAGRASAALGLMAQKPGSEAQAADRLMAASNLLTGDEAARSAFRAGHAYTALNRYGDAAAAYRTAASKAESPELKKVITQYTESGPFAVQMGVFSSKPNADRKAAESRNRTLQLGLGVPVVKSVASRGKVGAPASSYSVQVGSFQNRHAAALACQKLGSQAVVVAPE